MTMRRRDFLQRVAMLLPGAAVLAALPKVKALPEPPKPVAEATEQDQAAYTIPISGEDFKKLMEQPVIYGQTYFVPLYPVKTTEQWMHDHAHYDVVRHRQAKALADMQAEQDKKFLDMVWGESFEARREIDKVAVETINGFAKSQGGFFAWQEFGGAVINKQATIWPDFS